MVHRYAPLLACARLLVVSPLSHADNWTRQGADAGNTRYSADDISASAQLQPSYTKRFYGHWADYGTAYMYASSVVIRDGQAYIMTNDQPYPNADEWTDCQSTLFDWSTGSTIRNVALPGYPDWGNHSFHPGENSSEIDSDHFTNTVIWDNDDGRIYARRGGDHTTCGALDTSTFAWSQFGYSGYDANAFMQIYGDRIVYSATDTRLSRSYQSYKIGPEDWALGHQGTGSYPVGLSAPAIMTAASPSGWYVGLHADIPKIAQDTCVLAGNTYDPTTGAYTLWIQANYLHTTPTLRWCKSYASDNGGAQGFYTSAADYWKFLATESGDYAFFTRGANQMPTVRVLDLATGNEKWNMPLAGAAERPLMATHGDSLFIIGAGEQYKVDINTGAVAWTMHTAIQEAGYTITEDPAYQPVVLTDDTLWLVSGQQGSTMCDLLGISTADGHVMQDIDLAAKYAGTGEHIVAVNDVMAADGKIGVLLGIESDNDPYPNAYSYAMSGNLEYQDLLVFDAVPEPATLVVLALAGLATLKRQK